MQSWIHVIEWRANVRPQVTALVDDRGAAYTYAQLRAEVERKAGGWAGLGIPRTIPPVTRGCPARAGSRSAGRSASSTRTAATFPSRSRASC